MLVIPKTPASIVCTCVFVCGRAVTPRTASSWCAPSQTTGWCRRSGCGTACPRGRSHTWPGGTAVHQRGPEENISKWTPQIQRTQNSERGETAAVINYHSHNVQIASRFGKDRASDRESHQCQNSQVHTDGFMNSFTCRFTCTCDMKTGKVGIQCWKKYLPLSSFLFVLHICCYF